MEFVLEYWQVGAAFVMFVFGIYMLLQCLYDDLNEYEDDFYGYYDHEDKSK